MNNQHSVKDTIRIARADHTQAAFAKLLGTSQSLVSKYESGKANPPTGIIDKCMSIIHDRNSDGEISLGLLEKRIRKTLGGPSQADLRKVFAALLDAIENSHTRNQEN